MSFFILFFLFSPCFASRLIGVLNIIQDNVGRLYDDEDNASEEGEKLAFESTILVNQPGKTNRV